MPISSGKGRLTRINQVTNQRRLPEQLRFSNGRHLVCSRARVLCATEQATDYVIVLVRGRNGMLVLYTPSQPCALSLTSRCTEGQRKRRISSFPSYAVLTRDDDRTTGRTSRNNKTDSRLVASNPMTAPKMGCQWRQSRRRQQEQTHLGTFLCVSGRVSFFFLLFRSLFRLGGASYQKVSHPLK